jgi:hypothetical protein
MVDVHSFRGRAAAMDNDAYYRIAGMERKCRDD